MIIKWRSAIVVWWSFAWRASIYGLILGFLSGLLGHAIAEFLYNPDRADLYQEIGFFIGSIPAYMLAFKVAIEKHLPMLASLAANRTA